MAWMISLKMPHTAFASTGRGEIIFMDHRFMVDTGFWRENGIQNLYFNRRQT
jgi:hypothetical protein